MNTTSVGRQAEAKAAGYLKDLGYNILDQNWRTRLCEIDIVAQKAKVIYFVEVKYRKSSNWGGGLEYITGAKLKQMARAAELWVSNHKWHGDYALAGIEVMGERLEVTAFVTEL
jgi:uncharacterized protein (TIGR00252 family)